MSKLNRRAMLRQSSTLAAAAAALIPGPNVWAQQMPREPDRKLRIVAVGGHCDDPQTCAGGTLTLYADQGHEVVGLSITGGPMPPPGTDPEDRKFKDRLNCQKMADILKIRLDCLNYSGSNSGQFKLPIVYGAGSEINGQRYNEFTELLLDKYKPDVVFTHWPIDFHMDHRAASLLTHSAWLASGKKFPLYYFEAELGTQTQNFYPTNYVNVTSVEERYHQAFAAQTLFYDEIWPIHNLMRQMRGHESGCQFAEAFNHHPQSPTIPALPV